MSKLDLKKGVRAAMAGGAMGLMAARRVAYAPPKVEVAALAEAAAYSGPWSHGYAEVNGVRLHYAEIGRGSGPLVILLHGFPECWYTWRYIMPHLAPHYHVVAPDMRGYNWSDKPEGVSSYSLEEVSGDVAALIESLGSERAYVVGHDWGGSVAWHMGAHHADKVEKLVVINSPHPAALARELKTRAQLLRSWYFFFFQLPLLPEAAIRLTIRTNMRATAALPGAFPDEALNVYENAVSQPDAATAMLNYYRAAGRTIVARRNEAVPQVSVSTMLLWGMKDFALGPALLKGLGEWVPDLRIERVEESGHWLPEEAPGVVTERLLDFLA
jgi:pimeloyl-ACP methyl ester carboxylesterase